jgi:hypothetical protein
MRRALYIERQKGKGEGYTGFKMCICNNEQDFDVEVKDF